MTDYMVFTKNAATGERPDGIGGTEEGTYFGPLGWQQVGPDTVPARSARAAIAEVLKTRNAEGEFVAVPARSWKPVTVKVETKTALRFS